MAKETGLGIGPIRSCCWSNATLGGEKTRREAWVEDPGSEIQSKINFNLHDLVFFFFSFFWNSQPVTGDLVC